MPRDHLLRRVGNFIQEATGYSLVDTEHLRVQEALSREAMILANDLEEIGYVSMNFAQGRSGEPSQPTRRRWAQQARVVWLADPMAGASVEMLNEFTFGRGVARPRFKDKEAQEVVDEAWDDPQNQRVLTSFLAQIKLGNSLSVQSNVFLTMHDEGDDGKVKLSYLVHDSVANAMTDPENRQRALFYIASQYVQEWDYGRHVPKPVTGGQPKVYYYEAWGALEEALQERGLDDETAKKQLERYRAACRSEERDPTDPEFIDPGEPWTVPGLDDERFTLPPPKLVGEGKVWHLTDGNLDMEMIFGVPRMRRTIRWYTAYNDFMAARVNMMAAAAAFIMSKTVTSANPGTMERLAGKAMRASSDLRSAVDQAIGPDGVKAGPNPGSILGQSGGVKYEPLSLNSGAGNAMTDGQMLRAQVSAGDRFPQHYLGDVGNANLATATSMELPVLKHVEARQELVKGVFRWFIDRVIDRAIDVGRLDPNVSTEPEDTAELVATSQDDLALSAAMREGATVSEHEMIWRINSVDEWRLTQVLAFPDGRIEYKLLAREASEDKHDDEQDTGRDLTYEFGMPSPLRRMIGDLVAAAAQTATMADPNGLNTELTRVLLTLILSEGFEMLDAADVVDRIFPKDYDPMAELAKAQGQMGGAGGPQASQPNFFGPGATDQPADPANAYGAPKRATAPEKVPGAQEAYIEEMLRRGGLLLEAAEPEWEVPPMIAVGRAGQPIYLPGKVRGGVREGQVPMRVAPRISGLLRDFDRDVSAATIDALAAAERGDEIVVQSNGNGRSSS